MSDRDSFLRAIRASPDDDTPRLVFADWLDDHGDPLGELIRVQFELEPVRDQLDHPRVAELSEREAVLLGTHGHEWLGSVADIAAYPAFGPVFRRGLPEMVCLSLDTFLNRGAELFAACPTVREVCLFGVQDREQELFNCPLLKAVETLEVADWVDEGGGSETGVGMLQHVKRFRLWGDLDHHVPTYLVTAATPLWPELIEVVDLDDSRVRFGDTRAAIINERLGRELVRVVKPFEARFPLSGNVGRGFWAGHFDDGSNVLLAPISSKTGASIAFYPDGSLDDVDRIAGSASLLAAKRWRGFAPGLIRVQQETTNADGFAIRLWPRSYIRDYLRNPFARPPGVTDQWWANRGGVLRRWLHEGCFVIEWDGHEYWADASGKIIAS